MKEFGFSNRYCWSILCAVALLAGASSIAGARDTQSIRNWVTGDGTTDDSVGVAKAFEACKNNHFTLVVDCPVFIHVGVDIARPIFIDNDTTVQFTQDGKFIVDNNMIPAFVIPNSSHVRLLNWNVEYKGHLSLDANTDGYEVNGVPHPGPNPKRPGAFNDLTLTNWLEKHRGIKFTHSGPNISTSAWASPTNTSAVFFVIGSTNDLTVDHLKMSVPPSANGSDFIPMAFSITQGYTSNCTAQPLPGHNVENWVDVPDLSVPSNLNFSDITLDGYYMGFQGVVKNANFNNITGLRYGDLQDANGGTVGGVGKWFAPPHLFYFKYICATHPFDRRLSVQDLRIDNVKDLGPRVGTARDDDSTNTSGYANSLKLGAINSSVENYVSKRPDGLVDVLASNNLTLSDMSGDFDSSFLNDIYPGIRFPAHDYKDVTLLNVTLTDLSENPYSHAGPKAEANPIGSVKKGNVSGVTFNNVVLNLKRWSRGYDVQPHFVGSNNDTHVTVHVRG